MLGIAFHAMARLKSFKENRPPSRTNGSEEGTPWKKRNIHSAHIPTDSGDFGTDGRASKPIQPTLTWVQGKLVVRSVSWTSSAGGRRGMDKMNADWSVVAPQLVMR